MTCKKILFSITTHESIDALNLLIESILYSYNNSYVVLHVNSSWIDFNPDSVIFLNKKVFINTKKYSLSNSLEGKSGVHISNIEYFNSLNIDYDYVILSASNQFFLKNIDIDYIELTKYGSDFLSVSTDSKYYSLIPHPDTGFINSVLGGIKDKLKSIANKNGIFGGRHEGMFFSKDIGLKIISDYRHLFGDDINLCRCDEEIILHTLLYNIVDPTETDSLCYFHKTYPTIDTIVNFKHCNLIMDIDLFTKEKSNINKKYSIKGVDRKDKNILEQINNFLK
jgi:hypothetical protein